MMLVTFAFVCSYVVSGRVHKGTAVKVLGEAYSLVDEEDCANAVVQGISVPCGRYKARPTPRLCNLSSTRNSLPLPPPTPGRRRQRWPRQPRASQVCGLWCMVYGLRFVVCGCGLTCLVSVASTRLSSSRRQ
jgi:hypothetical protein